MSRRQLLLLAGALGVLTTGDAAPARCEELSTERGLIDSAAPGELPPHLRAVQRNLGGSVLEQFDSLQSDRAESTPWWKQFDQSPQATATDSPEWPIARALTANASTGDAASAAPGTWLNWTSAPAPAVVPATANAPAHSVPPAVTALRATAAELDEAANRLEELDLYRQSDALRELAQRLRVDARQLTMSRGSTVPGPFPPPHPVEPVTPTMPRIDSGNALPTPTPFAPTLAPDPSSMPARTFSEPRDETPTATPAPDLGNSPADAVPADRAE